MSTHNIRFYWEITKIIPTLSSDTLLVCFTAVYLLVESKTLLHLSCITRTLAKNRKIRTPQQMAVIVLQFDQCGFTIK